MDILEGNKLMADFMGAKYNKDTNFDIDSDCLWLPNHGICNYVSAKYGVGKRLRYNFDWNWLMEVVEKIEGSHYAVRITRHTCLIDCTTAIPYFKIIDGYGNSKIEIVYNACINFIKLHYHD